MILYTKYFYLFQAAGLVLLVAMIGAIVLTHREREGVKRQKIATQVARGRESVEIVKVPTGRGI
jgi:NADH-quinone oxidoreductase subunit J